MPYVENGQLDATILASMGYQQQLSRGIRNWAMSAAFCLVAIGTVPFTGLDIVLQFGGAGTALVACLVTMFFTVLTSCAIAEVCSAYPNAGAMYHWAGQLVAPRFAPLTSFVTGMLLLVGNVTNVTTSAVSVAQWAGSIVTVRGGGELSTGATVGLTLAIVTAWALLNLQRIKALAWCHVAFALVHVAVAVAVVVSMYALNAPHGGATLWSNWANGSGFIGADGYVALLGLSGAIYSLSGYDVRRPVPVCA